MTAKKKKKDLESANEPTSEPITFSKDQLVKSVKYARWSDLVSALLDNDKRYTTDEVDRMISRFLKSEVS